MNSYELMLIFDPELGEEKIGGIVSKVEGKIKSLAGELEKIDKWGAKKLPSRIKKAKKLTQAYYVVIYFKGETSLPGELQGYLKVTENIIRYSVLHGVPKPEAEIPVAPAEAKEKVEAVHVGEIKEGGPAPFGEGTGEILGES